MRRILRKKQDVTLLIFFWFLTIAWLILIFWFSSQDSTSSNEVSMKVTEKVVAIVADYSDYDEVSIELVVAELNKIVREAAHVIIYFIFGLLVATLLNQYVIKYLFVFSCMVCFPIPILDEYNQKFRDAGRVFDTLDLAKDWAGSAVGILLICIIVGFVKQCKEIFGTY
ncbi:MAG: VanZ family protein [Lachnospiraceae bacterium]